MGEAVIYATPAAAVPEEVHLRDEEPAARIHSLNMGNVASTTRALHAGLKDDRGVAGGHRADAVAAPRGAGGPVLGIAHVPEVFVTALVLRPPGTLAEGPGVEAARATDSEGGMAGYEHPGVRGRPGRDWRRGDTAARA